MQDFQYQRPKSVADAASAFGQAEDTRYLAGGQTLIPVMKQRLAQPAALVDLAAIVELQGIATTPSEVVIGAMTRHAEVAASAEVRRLIPALAALAGGIGDPHVRNRGTIGGSLANNDPSADYPASALALGATIETDRRSITADEFFQGLFTTALDDGEIIMRVHFPLPKRAAYVKFPNPASRYALVGVMVADGPAGVRVAVTGAGSSGVFRMPEMEAALSKSFRASALDGIAPSADDMIADLHATGAYRAHLVNVIARRAVMAAGG